MTVPSPTIENLIIRVMCHRLLMVVAVGVAAVTFVAFGRGTGGDGPIAAPLTAGGISHSLHPAPTTTELHDYAALACTALLTWAVDARAGTPAGQPQGDDNGAERERLVAAYAYLAESTEQATSNIAELGTPAAAGGGAGAALLLAAVDESAGAYRAAQARAAELPDEGFAQARAALLASTDGAVRDAVAGLPRLSGDQAGSALDSAIADDPGCALAGEAVRDL